MGNQGISVGKIGASARDSSPWDLVPVGKMARVIYVSVLAFGFPCAWFPIVDFSFSCLVLTVIQDCTPYQDIY